MYDAVHLFARALDELDRSQVKQQPIIKANLANGWWDLAGLWMVDEIQESSKKVTCARICIPSFRENKPKAGSINLGTGMELCASYFYAWGPLALLIVHIHIHIHVLNHTWKGECWTREKGTGETGESTDPKSGSKIPTWLNVCKKLTISSLCVELDKMPMVTIWS